jgi:2-keto-4-pentenoate hydratase/2-oxohepta-3-ene-1,7-dioic acid hydratase in catechol pathway
MVHRYTISLTMRYATFSLSSDSAPRLGLVQGDRLVDLSGAFPGGLLDLIRRGPSAWRQTPPAGAATHAMKDVRLHAPIPRPTKNIFCLGLNYLAHMQESSAARGRESKVPEVPVFFTKAPTAVNGPYDPVPWDPSITQQVDYEAELGVIIGKSAKNLSRASALESVFGYTIINDTSARDLQIRHLQWFKGKSLDGFCPMGPVVVTADEFGDPQTKKIGLRLNGETRQSSTTADMIFPVNVMLEFLSRGMTLEPGDIIATGTPEGVGLGRTPPEYMKDGDVMETEVEGIGMLRNRIQAV